MHPKLAPSLQAESVVSSQSEQRQNPVGRLAPSPTGLLHLGHARTFLLAYWHIRSRGGRLLLRIDDLDQARASRQMADAALFDLEWLGLDWDGTACRQTDHVEAYRSAASDLLARGKAYPCVCSRRDLQRVQSAPHQDDDEPRYPGTCSGRFASVEQAERASGKLAGIRFAVPSGLVQFTDGIAGPQAHDVFATVGDFLITRRDKSAAYQLAVVVDDALTGVTEVFRGDDLLPSTGRQHLLQRALNLPHPKWFHAPLVLDEHQRRLAKRHDALSIRALREGGVTARQIVTWVARSALPQGGLPSRDLLQVHEVTDRFDLAHLTRGPVVMKATGFAPG